MPNATFEALVRQGKLAGAVAQEQQRISPEAQEMFAQAGIADLAEANRRYAIIAPFLSGGQADGAPLSRAGRRWRRKYREAQRVHGCGYVGLLPRWRQRGNRRAKLPEATAALTKEFIENDYETHKQKRKFEVYGLLVRACQERGVTPPSYKTFAAAVDRRPRYEQVHKRRGRRAAYKDEPFYWELEQTTPRHGDRPFEIVHLDHTQLDIELRCPRTGRNLGKP